MLLAALVAMLTGCARERPRPATLEAVSPQIAGRQAWQFRLPGVGFRLALAVRDGGDPAQALADYQAARLTSESVVPPL